MKKQKVDTPRAGSWSETIKNFKKPEDPKLPIETWVRLHTGLTYEQAFGRPKPLSVNSFLDNLPVIV